MWRWGCGAHLLRFPNVQPGSTRPDKQQAGNKASNSGRAKDTSKSGRRAVKKTEYKSQTKLADFVAVTSVFSAVTVSPMVPSEIEVINWPAQDSHLLDWLEGIDPTWLHREQLKDQSRVRLFSVLAFNSGWLPEDSEVGNDLDATVTAGNAQYHKRGKPSEHTAWSPKEQHQFMRDGS